MTVMGGIPSQEVPNKMLALYANIVLMGGEGIRKWDAAVALVKKERVITQQLKNKIVIHDDQIADLSQKVAKLEKGDYSKSKLKTKPQDLKRNIKKLKKREELLRAKVSGLKEQVEGKNDSVKCLVARVAELEAKQKTDAEELLAREGEWKSRVKVLELDDQLREEKRWFAKDASNHSFEKLRRSYEFLSSHRQAQVGCHRGLLKGYADKTNELPMERSEYYLPDAESKFEEMEWFFPLVEYPYLKRLDEDCDITVDEFMAISPKAAPSAMRLIARPLMLILLLMMPMFCHLVHLCVWCLLRLVLIRTFIDC